MVEQITGIMISGFVWDLMKKGANVTGKYIKDKLQNWIIDEHACEVIAGEINNTPEPYRKTEKLLGAYLDDNERIKESIAKVVPQNNNTIANSTFTGSTIIQGSTIGTQTNTHNHNYGETKELPKKI